MCYLKGINGAFIQNLQKGTQQETLASSPLFLLFSDCFGCFVFMLSNRNLPVENGKVALPTSKVRGLMRRASRNENQVGQHCKFTEN